MRRLTLTLMAAGFLVACNRTPTAPTGVPLSASRSDHGSAPALEWGPGTSYDYGTVDPASPSSVTFTLTNTGGKSSGTLTVSLSASTVYSITADGCTGESLGPNKSCTVTVEFAPTGGGTFTATLTADAEHGSASLDLTGEGPAPDLVMLSPAVFSENLAAPTKLYTFNTGEFIAPGATGTFTEFTIKNEGSAASGSLVVTPADYSVVSNDQCTGTTLAPGGECSFQAAVSGQYCSGAGPIDAYLDVYDPSSDYIRFEMVATCDGS